MNFYFIITGFLVSFLFAYLLVPLVIRKSGNWKLVSFPNERSMHHNIQPTSGGIAFAIPVLLLEILFGFLLTDHNFNYKMLRIALGGFLVLVLGVLDDKYNIKAKYKLFLQIMIAMLMCLMGFKIQQLTNPFGSEIQLGFYAYPFTIFWYLVIMNAINLIDGLDGLATGISVITCLVLIFTGWHYNNLLVVYICTLLSGSLLAFLKYNYPPSRLFMGDSGSLFIGFQLATVSIIGSFQLKGLTTITLLIPVTVLFVPLFDTLLSVLRRIKSGQNVFKADKNHIHHRMLNVGFSTKTVVFIAWFITALFGIISLGYVFISKQIMSVMLFLLSIVLGAIFYFLLRKEFFK